MQPCILDTNILQGLFKGNPTVSRKVRQHISLYDHLYITIITYYEVLKGLKYQETLGTTSRRQAYRRQQTFQTFCWQNQILPLDEASCREAADIYADLRQRGKNYRAGSDILIAGIARAGGYTLVTQNTKDFVEIKKLKIENWLS